MSANRLLWPLLGALLCASAPSAAAALSASDLQIHGFLGQGWVTSEGNNVNGNSTGRGGSTEFRELGINASWRPLGSLLLSGQMAAIEAGKAIDEDMVLEYALADYTALQTENGRLGLRAGKLKLPIGLYNDSRDMVFTRPGVIMPNSVYMETNGARAFGYFSGEGIGAYGDWYMGEHALYAELIGAVAQELDDTAAIAILRRQASGKFELDRAMVLRLADDYDGGRWRGALSLLTSDLSYVPDGSTPSRTNPFTLPGSFEFDQAVLSLQYNVEKVSATAEVVLRHIELSDISPFPSIGATKQDPAGWYLQGSYRLTPKWQWLLRYDEQIRELDDRRGYEQAATSPQRLPRHYFFARDWTAGTRYDVLPNVAVWAEFHYVDGVGWVNPLDNPGFGSGGADRYWNLFTVMLGLRF